MHFKTVRTKRLVIRSPRFQDLLDFLAYRNHPENLRFQPVDTMTEADAAAFLQHQAVLDIGILPCWMMCAVELKDDCRVIGEVGIYLAAETESAGDIGWSIHPNFQGRGFAAEAATALLNIAFLDRKLHRVTASGDQRNIRSTKLMERLGMRREKSVLKSLLWKGEWRDEYQYAILRHEWCS